MVRPELESSRRGNVGHRMTYPRQRALVPPLAGEHGVMRLDHSNVWNKRVRLQMELSFESNMEAWLESIGNGHRHGAPALTSASAITSAP